MIRPATPTDADEICQIYNEYIRTSTITFEEEPLAPEEMARRIVEVTAAWPWLVYEEAGSILGYAYASQWQKRSAYRHSVESTVYLKASAQGQRIGRRLYEDLLHRLEKSGVHCVVAGIALPNERSVALHERVGFKKVAHFQEVGWKFERWIDVGHWQLIFGDPNC
jgi:phosphinothricin acetyltransferase